MLTERQLCSKIIFAAVPKIGRESQVQLLKREWCSLMRIIATGRHSNVLLKCFFFLPTSRNELFPQCKGTNYFFFKPLNQMQCIHALMGSGIAATAMTAGKDFAAAVAIFFLWHIIRQSCPFKKFFFILFYCTGKLLLYLLAQFSFLNSRINFFEYLFAIP